MVARGVKVKVFAEPALSLLELVGLPVTVNVTVLFELLRLSVPEALLVCPEFT